MTAYLMCSRTFTASGLSQLFLCFPDRKMIFCNKNRSGDSENLTLFYSFLFICCIILLTNSRLSIKLQQIRDKTLPQNVNKTTIALFAGSLVYQWEAQSWVCHILLSSFMDAVFSEGVCAILSVIKLCNYLGHGRLECEII